MVTGPMLIADLERLAAADAADLDDVVKAFATQADVERETPVPEGALTFETFTALLKQAASRRGSAARSNEARAVWRRFLVQTDPAPPPSFALADFLVTLYERNTEPARSTLLALAHDGPLVHGVFGGLKRITKRAEGTHDFEMLSALNIRFDEEATRRHRRWDRIDVSRGTLIYLRKRAWRFLRGLGVQVPRLYAMFAAQLLSRISRDASFDSMHIASHVVGRAAKFARKKKRGRAAKTSKGPAVIDPLASRPFGDAWKLSPDPLFYILEKCSHRDAAVFAINSLHKDFPEALRSPSIPWLNRLARSSVERVHELLVDVLTETPELHQTKLRDVGLHDAVLLLLTSPSSKARAYAIGYARAHATDMSIEQLLTLADEDAMEERFGGTYEDTAKFASGVLTAKAPRDLGLHVLGKMVAISATNKWAAAAIQKSFERSEIPEVWLIDMLFGEDEQHELMLSLVEKKFAKGALGAAFWTKALDDPRHEDGYGGTSAALAELAELPLTSIDPTWLLNALTRVRISSEIGEMLQKADALPAGIDVERLKGLVFHPAHRAVALSVLGSPKLVKPRDLGLGWLLALARRADATLHDFAHRILLQHMKPADFDEGGNADAGVAKLFALASGEKEPEPVRTFAQTYLRCHHMGIGASQPEAKEIELVPTLDRSVYTAARIWPMLWDERPDVRKLGILIARAELRAWGYQTRVYELGDISAKEVRGFMYEALLGAGDKTADVACTLAPEELSAAGVLGMAESREQKTREVAMELFRRHYAQLGGAERLGWLMQSADREVQKFAVRLLWEKHRPRALPPGYKPPKPSGVPFEQAGDFSGANAVQTLLRRTLLSLPPGRSKEASDGTAKRRRLPASEVKRNLVDIVRDLGLADAELASLSLPILFEMVGSAAKGEHAACLSALVTLRRAHPSLVRLGEGDA